MSRYASQVLRRKSKTSSSTAPPPRGGQTAKFLAPFASSRDNSAATTHPSLPSRPDKVCRSHLGVAEHSLLRVEFDARLRGERKRGDRGSKEQRQRPCHGKTSDNREN